MREKTKKEEKDNKVSCDKFLQSSSGNLISHKSITWLIESERKMSYWFKNRKVCDRILAPIPAPSLYSDEMISDASNGDESDDTRDGICSVNASGSPDGNDQDWNNNEKQCSSGSSDVENEKKKIQIFDGNFEMPAIEELTINSKLEFEMLPNFENLSLNTNCESLNKIADLSVRDQKPLAGVVTSVAKVIGLIVVKPHEPRDVLLYIGSPVFFRNSNSSQVSKLGCVIDVFGPTCAPYYCVKPGHNYIELVREGSEIFYSPDHPRTEFMQIKLTDKSRYTVMYSSTCSLGDYQKVAGQTRDDDFSRKTSREDSPNRKMYRRRRHRDTSNYHRGPATYQNKYQYDHPHLYFDY